MNKFKTLLCIATAVVAGCATDTQGLKKDRKSEQPYTFSQFTDIPIPDNSNMDLDRSMMFGRETDWMGKMTFYAPYNVSEVFDFYMEEMPKFHWRELTSVRGSNSVLTYRYNCRVATVQLVANGMRGGTTVIISMAPSPAKRCSRAASTEVTTENTEPTVTQEQVPSQNYYNVNPGYNQQPQMQQPQYNYQNNMGVNTSDKSAAGSLGLGNASNMYYNSNSNGVGQPPRF